MNPILSNFGYVFAVCVLFLLILMYLFYVKYPADKIKDDDCARCDFSAGLDDLLAAGGVFDVPIFYAFYVVSDCKAL